MATSRAKKQKSEAKKAARPRLRSIPGGAAEREAPAARTRGEAPRSRAEPPRNRAEAMEQLFSSTVNRATAPKKKGRKREIAPIPLPEELGKIADLYAAGKSVMKEIEFKVGYASQALRDFCEENFVRMFSAMKKKPPSLDYTAERSRFKFVQTSRTTLTPDKVERLRELDIPVDEYTELSGIDINMSEIKRHGLEEKLRDGLASLGVSKGVIEEVFTPKRELNPAFYDNLHTIVRESLDQGEELEGKMLEVMKTLNPAVQIRNVELKELDVEQAFEFVLQTEIEAEEEWGEGDEDE